MHHGNLDFLYFIFLNSSTLPRSNLYQSTRNRITDEFKSISLCGAWFQYLLNSTSSPYAPITQHHGIIQAGRDLRTSQTDACWAKRGSACVTAWGSSFPSAGLGMGPACISHSSWRPIPKIPHWKHCSLSNLMTLVTFPQSTQPTNH